MLAIGRARDGTIRQGTVYPSSASLAVFSGPLYPAWAFPFLSSFCRFTRFIPRRRPVLLYRQYSFVSRLRPSFAGEIFHAKVLRPSGVKHRSANRPADCPAAFRKSKMNFRSPPCPARRVGYSVKFPGCLLAFPSFPRCAPCM